MNNFVYHIPTKVYFGENQLGNLGDELKQFGSRVLLVYGGGSIKKTGLYDRIMAEIKKAGLECFELPGVEPNPRVASVNKGAQICKEKKIDVLWPSAAVPPSTRPSSSARLPATTATPGTWSPARRPSRNACPS
jgi:alcohol dehydrogenase YqhD (iron-dependent ADH family)